MEKSITSSIFDKGEGALKYTLRNDYMFRALLQRNPKVLKHLICALFHLKPEEVEEVVITNPVELGRAIDNKDFFLDIKLCMNKKTIINLEMQLVNEGNWVERSLTYLCRSFDHLNSGQNYAEVKPTHHIGFLNYTLFKKTPEFYAVNYMMDDENHHIYTDKFSLRVLDLTQIELATEEDKAWKINHWAELFKATTWEEIKMVAGKDEIFNEAAETLYELSADEKIRLQCEAREEYNRKMKHYEYVKEQLAEKEKEIIRLKTLLESAGIQ